MSNVPTLFDSLGKLGQHKTIDLKQFRCPGLPEGYKLCAYVQPTARTCFIDTGIKSTDEVGFQVTYQWDGTNPLSAQGEVIIGAGDADLDTRQWINNTSTGYLHIGWGTDRHHTTTSPAQSDIPTDKSIIWGQVNFMMSNTASCSIPTSDDIQLGYDSTFSGETLYLFASHGVTTHNNHTLARLYRCRISDGRRIKRDFIPVRRESDGKYGLFESIEKKIYFPEEGTLTGSELSSLWDYSHFAGAEGAYIDDYPTPDSPNFVKASGVEAGMAQIREALMVGPMLTKDYKTEANQNFCEETLPYFSRASVNGTSVFYNLPNTSIIGTNVDNSAGVYGAFEVPTNRRLLLAGQLDSKFKSFYLVFESFLSDKLSTGGVTAQCTLVHNQNNCNYLTHITSDKALSGIMTPVGGARVNTPILNNTTVRIVNKTSTRGVPSLNEISTYSRSIGRYISSPTRLYLPLLTRMFCPVVNSTLTTDVYRGKEKFLFYMPSLQVGAPTEQELNILDVTDTPKLYPEISLATYALRYLNHSNSRSVRCFIDAQYFNIVSIETEEAAIGTATGIAYSKLVSPLQGKYTPAAGEVEGVHYFKTPGEVIVKKFVTAADSASTTGLTTTITTYSLLSNDDDRFGEECRQLREVLWNTNGLNGTSTGFLDGVIQVGQTAGAQFANYHSLVLRLITHPWSD